MVVFGCFLVFVLIGLFNRLLTWCSLMGFLSFDFEVSSNFMPFFVWLSMTNPSD